MGTEEDFREVNEVWGKAKQNKTKQKEKEVQRLRPGVFQRKDFQRKKYNQK